MEAETATAAACKDNYVSMEYILYIIYNTAQVQCCTHVNKYLLMLE